LAAAEAMQAALPNSVFALIPGAGHASNLTHPDLVNPAIASFLASPPDRKAGSGG
jgi:pimeloyl-ACP methyl ester carboxylesterase